MIKNWFIRQAHSPSPATTTDRPAAGTSVGSEPRGPLAAVTQAMEQGASTVATIVAYTGLQESTVTAVMEHLERVGYLRRTREISCGGSCGGCELADAHGTCNHAPTMATQKGLVTLTLTRQIPPHDR